MLVAIDNGVEFDKVERHILAYEGLSLPFSAGFLQQWDVIQQEQSDFQ